MSEENKKIDKNPFEDGLSVERGFNKSLRK